MKTPAFLTLILISLTINLQAQSSGWFTLPGAPSNTVKLDDIFFIDENTGWVANGRDNMGSLYKTTNGGDNWAELSSPPAFYRSIGFANHMTGWAGDLNNARIFRTSDGGASWNIIPISVSEPSGVCGIFVLDSNTVYATGRYQGPPYFYKSTNSGINWTAIDMSAHASGLIDIYFMNKDTGFVFGGVGAFFTNANNACMLYTTNGGVSWTNVFRSDRGREWGWKINFINANTGFGVIESWRSTDTVGFIKTTNGGLNWSLSRFKTNDMVFHAQAIMFNNEMTGWIGGYGNSGGSNYTDGKTYQTTDGGATWQPMTFGYNINRFRKLNDSLLYAAGKTIYKYSPKHVAIGPVSSVIPENFALLQNYPNPFNPETTIRFNLPAGFSDNVQIKIFDALGREVHTLLNRALNAGEYQITFTGSAYQSGVYYYKLAAGNSFSSVKKMILVK